jgi:hypothetical protein
MRLNLARRLVFWIAAWLVLVGLGLDYYNWEKQPRMWFGHPVWLWVEVILVLVVAVVFGLLAKLAWEDE